MSPESERLTLNAEAIATHLGREYGWSESRVVHCTKHIQDALDKAAFHQGANWMLDDIRGSLTGWPHLGCDTVVGEQVERIVKTAIALALEQAAGAAERWLRYWVLTRNPNDKDASCELSLPEAIRAISPDSNYITLREADARIDEYRANEAAYSASLYVHGPGDVRTNFEKWRMWKEQHVAALTEARDKLVKK